MDISKNEYYLAGYSKKNYEGREYYTINVMAMNHSDNSKGIYPVLRNGKAPSVSVDVMNKYLESLDGKFKSLSRVAIFCNLTGSIVEILPLEDPKNEVQ